MLQKNCLKLILVPDVSQKHAFLGVGLHFVPSCIQCWELLDQERWMQIIAITKTGHNKSENTASSLLVIVSPLKWTYNNLKWSKLKKKWKESMLN